MPQYYYEPGYRVDVEVFADSNGDVANEGQGVALIGEGPAGPQVELQEAVTQKHVGILANEPEDLRDPTNSESDFSSGDTVGMATVILGVPVMWYEVDSGFTPSAGDLVEVGDGGDVEAYSGPTASGLGGAVTNNLGLDGSGNLETDNGSDIDINLSTDAFPDGFILTTVARGWGIGGRVAVVPLRGA